MRLQWRRFVFPNLLHAVLATLSLFVPSLCHAAGFVFTCKSSPYDTSMIVSGESPKGPGVIVTGVMPPMSGWSEVRNMDVIAMGMKADANRSIELKIYHPDFNVQRTVAEWVVSSPDKPPASGQAECKEGMWVYP